MHNEVMDIYDEIGEAVRGRADLTDENSMKLAIAAEVCARTNGLVSALSVFDAIDLEGDYMKFSPWLVWLFEESDLI